MHQGMMHSAALCIKLLLLLHDGVHGFAECVQQHGEGCWVCEQLGQLLHSLQANTHM